MLSSSGPFNISVGFLTNFNSEKLVAGRFLLMKNPSIGNGTHFGLGLLCFATSLIEDLIVSGTEILVSAHTHWD